MSRHTLLTLGSILIFCTLTAMEMAPQSGQAPTSAQSTAHKKNTLADPFWRIPCDHHIVNKVAHILTIGARRLDLSRFVPGIPGYQEFHGEPIHIPLHTWIDNIITVAKMNRLEVAIACINISRLLEKKRELMLTTLNIRRLFFISCLIATKALRDYPYFNKDWKRMCYGTYSPTEINQLEIQFLKMIDFQAIPPEFTKDFEKFCATVESFKDLQELTPEAAQQQTAN